MEETKKQKFLRKIFIIGIVIALLCQENVLAMEAGMDREIEEEAIFEAFEDMTDE